MILRVGGPLLLVGTGVLAAGCGSGVYGSAATYQNPTQATTTTQAPQTTSPVSTHQFGGPRNLLTNGSFEQGTLPWGPIPGSQLQLTTSPTRFGSKALLVQAKSPARPPAQLGAQVAVVEGPIRGSRYDLECWAQGSRALSNSTLVIRLAALTPNGSRQIPAGTLRTRTPMHWHQYSLRGRLPIRLVPNSVLIALVYAEHSVSGNGWLALDGAVIKRVYGAGSAGRP